MQTSTSSLPGAASPGQPDSKGDTHALEIPLRTSYRRSSRREAPEAGFICEHCHQTVPATAAGTAHRNHCPRCLWSLHVDLAPGDRGCGCKGPMEPIAVWVRRDGEWAIVHRCQRCGAIRTNRIAGDDNELALMSLAVRPLASPPFPLDRVASGAEYGR